MVLYYHEMEIKQPGKVVTHPAGPDQPETLEVSSMAEHPLTLSASLTQSQPRALAAVHAWALLKALCGHSRPFFGDGPAALPVEPCAPILPILPGMVEVCHA